MADILPGNVFSSAIVAAITDTNGYSMFAAAGTGFHWRIQSYTSNSAQNAADGVIQILSGSTNPIWKMGAARSQTDSMTWAPGTGPVTPTNSPVYVKPSAASLSASVSMTVVKEKD